MARFAWALVLVALISGCSSAPPVPDAVQDRKNRAADYLKFSRQSYQEAQYEQALSFALIAVDLNTAVDYEAGMAVAWNTVATAQAALGKAVEARAALVQAEALAAVAGDKTLVLQVAVNLVQADLADGHDDKARARLDALRPVPSTAEGAALEHALGTLEKALDHGAEALAAFERALAINTTLKLKQEAASNHFMIAAVLGKAERWTEAETHLETALALDKAMENTLGIGQDLRALGTVAVRRGAPQAAMDRYIRAYRLFQAAGLADQQRRTLELLLPVLAERGLKDDQARYQAAHDALLPSQR